MNQEISESDPNLHIALLLDFAASRYNCLPSEFVRRADTMDLYIMDIACSYQNYKQEQAQAASEGRTMAPKLSVEQMQSMIERVKHGSNKKS